MDIEWTELGKDTEEEALKKEKQKQIEQEKTPEGEVAEAKPQERLLSGGLGELIISLGNVIYQSQNIGGYTEYEEQKIREFANAVEENRHIKIPSEVGLGVYALSPLIRKWTADLKAKKEQAAGAATNVVK
ncbi:MAG: hypothetical protein QW478_06700 [Candidatus Micrarchaeaceae archaeon]